MDKKYNEIKSLLLGSSRNCFEDVNIESEYDIVNSFNEELNRENKRLKTTLSPDYFFHKMVGEILSQTVNNKIRSK